MMRPIMLTPFVAAMTLGLAAGCRTSGVAREAAMIPAGPADAIIYVSGVV